MPTTSRSRELVDAMRSSAQGVITHALAAVSPAIARAVISMARSFAMVVESDDRPAASLLSPGGMADVPAATRYVTEGYLPHFRVTIKKMDFALPGSRPTYQMTIEGEPDSPAAMMTGQFVSVVSDARSAVTFMAIWSALRMANEMGALTISIDEPSQRAIKDIDSLFMLDNEGAVVEDARKFRDRVAVGGMACEGVRTGWSVVTAGLTSPELATLDSAERDATGAPDGGGGQVM